MKKLLLAALALAGTFSLAQANTFTVNNTTGCTIYLGLNSLGLQYVTPGTHVVNVPGDITNAKFEYTSVSGNIGSFAVGLGFPYVSTAGYPAPACTTTSGFISAVWQQTSATGPATLTFL